MKASWYVWNTARGRRTATAHVLRSGTSAHTLCGRQPGAKPLRVPGPGEPAVDAKPPRHCAQCQLGLR